jgi:hypothetical protein
VKTFLVIRVQLEPEAHDEADPMMTPAPSAPPKTALPR